jgi:hypothetical protein
MLWLKPSLGKWLHGFALVLVKSECCLAGKSFGLNVAYISLEGSNLGLLTWPTATTGACMTPTWVSQRMLFECAPVPWVPITWQGLPCPGLDATKGNSYYILIPLDATHALVGATLHTP